MEDNYGECAPDGDRPVRSFALSTYHLRLRFKGVYVLTLYKRLLIVVFMLGVNHAFCLSEVGSVWIHVLAARKGISLVIGHTCFIVGILSRI